MSCNCNTTPVCTKCSAGLTCNCPPDYSVLPQPVVCGCCPTGYKYVGVTPNFPNGMCECDMSGLNPTACVSLYVAAIPCTSCTDSISSECVFLPDTSCFGIKGPYPLQQFIEYLCSDAFTMKMLQNIGLSTELKAALCQIVSVCPTVGSTVPIPGPIVVTVP